MKEVTQNRRERQKERKVKSTEGRREGRKEGVDKREQKIIYTEENKERERRRSKDHARGVCQDNRNESHVKENKENVRNDELGHYNKYIHTKKKEPRHEVHVEVAKVKRLTNKNKKHRKNKRNTKCRKRKRILQEKSAKVTKTERYKKEE